MALLESVYSGVFGFRGSRFVLIISELKKLGFWAKYFGIVYLEAITEG
jgi:hypothetical protein